MCINVLASYLGGLLIISGDRRDACTINQKGMGNYASKGLCTVLYTFIGHGHKMKHCNCAISTLLVTI